MQKQISETMKKIAVIINCFFVRFFFIVQQSEQDIQTELQQKQRELLELKKKKLELELAATQKQLSTVAVVAPPSHPAFVDPMLLNTQEVGIRDSLPNVMPAIVKPNTSLPPPNYIIPPTQMPVSNVRARIAPVNPQMVIATRLRDPRLARQTPQAIPKSHGMNHSTQPMNNHLLPKIASRK